jgi:hypothetical protein
MLIENSALGIKVMICFFFLNGKYIINNKQVSGKVMIC